MKNGNLTTDVYLFYARTDKESAMTLRGIYMTPDAVKDITSSTLWAEYRVEHHPRVAVQIATPLRDGITFNLAGNQG
jgi:hypothetical protein